MLDYFGISSSNYDQPPRYNIAPGQNVTAIISDGEQRRIGPLQWGLIPAWAKDAKIGSLMINARAETLSQKPAFKSLLSRKRCLIPADGFYEWKKAGKTKQPMRMVLTNRKVFAFAGLYDTWIKPDGMKLSTCTVITTKPNELMAEIHDRMPVILLPEHEERWLDKRIADPSHIMPLLAPYPPEYMRAYPVGALVGNVRNDVPACVAEIQI